MSVVELCEKLINNLPNEHGCALMNELERKFANGFDAERDLEVLCTKSKQKTWPLYKLVEMLPTEFSKFSIDTEVIALDKVLSRYTDFTRERPVVVKDNEIVDNIEFVLALAYLSAGMFLLGGHIEGFRKASYFLDSDIPVIVQ